MHNGLIFTRFEKELKFFGDVVLADMHIVLMVLMFENGLQQMTLKTHLEYNESIIEEREQGIAEISQQIREVNEIFQDLAVLVNDQVGLLATNQSCF